MHVLFHSIAEELHTINNTTFTYALPTLYAARFIYKHMYIY